jgi:hypothetical protein
MKKQLLLFALVLCSSSIFAQWFTSGNNLSTGTEWLGSITNFPLNIRTNNTNRMKLNGNINYAINNLPAQNRDGYLLLGRNNDLMGTNTSIYAPNFGAYSLLHLNGIGSVAQ